MNASIAQGHVLNSKTRGTIFLSSIGGGKTHALVLKSILLALEGKRGLVVSFSNNNLRDNLIPLYHEILSELELEYTLVTSPAINITINHTQIMLRTGSNPDKLRGPSVSYFMIDEAREFPSRDIFDILLGRLRKGKNLQWFIFTTTRGKDWTYSLIKEEKLLDIFKPETRLVSNEYMTVIRTIIDEVPHLSDEYVTDLKRQYTTSFSKQELYALIIDGSGEIFNPDWFRIESLPRPIKGLRFWDLAVTTNASSDYSVGCLMSKENGVYYINNMKRVKLQYPDLRKVIIDTALEDGPGIHIGIEVAGQQQAILDDLRRESLLANHIIKKYRPTKDKITRSYPFASQAELNNVILNDESWVREFKDECSTFSAENVARGIGHDDQIDACTGAYSLLNKRAIVGFTNLPI